ncbi:tyrosine-type recombinase/integrase [Bifidobacterium scardovii]|nr:tyrosine-type recombinase/integrase [Bifidobacterium scardovii]MDK6350910.1 tyrosine-type recombinase/integrase [Bifidobacterium scardovii]
MKSLRHFHATTLLQAGVPVKTVQHRLGHASAVMTLQVYAHFVPADDDSAAGVIGAALADAGQVRDRRRNLRAV